MIMTVNVDVDVQKILKKYGLGQSDAFRKALAVNVRRRCDKYVPMDTGALKNTAQVSSNGRAITYVQRYAAPQYTKNYHHDDPNRGPHWDKRMMINEGAELIADMQRFAEGRSG